MSAHFGAVFWHGRETVANYIGAPVMVGPDAFTADILAGNYFNCGVLGVAVFFLISGFVIPLSLLKLNRPGFLVARILRIYPAYAASLLIGLAAVWLSCRYWGHPFMWDIATVLQNTALVNTVSGAASVDLVNWTLAIEVKFYLIACLFASVLRRGLVWPLLALAAVIFAANKFTHTPFGTEMAFIPFMFIGVFFNYRLRGLIDNRKMIAAVATAIAFFFAGWEATPWPGAFNSIAPNYAYAVLIFAAAYHFRSTFRTSSFLDFFADISYPLYVMHSLVGYSAMRCMLNEGVRYRYAFVLAMLLAVSLAYLLHRLVEQPATIAGKRLGQLVTRRNTKTVTVAA